MVTEVEKTILIFLSLFLPNSNVINLLIAVAKVPDITENIATTPPTTLYIPKSSTPSDCKFTREVKRLIIIIKIMRT